MIILTIRTDNPEAEIGLFEYNKELAYEKWQAHRELSATIHDKIAKTLSVKGLTIENLGGIVCFKGPGSFTGLRIGLTIANALAVGLSIPIVATHGNDWIQKGIDRLGNSENESLALPAYGNEPHVTKPKK